MEKLARISWPLICVLVVLAVASSLVFASHVSQAAPVAAAAGRAAVAAGDLTWVTKLSMPQRRRDLGVVVDDDDKIYAIGGTAHNFTSFADVYRYDPAANTWTTLRSLPQPRQDMGVAVINGKVYAIGGGDAAVAKESSLVYEYDPATNSWVNKANLDHARYGLAAAAPGNGKIYAIGGMDAYGVVNTVEEYDPAANTWATRASMLTRRSFFGAAVANGKIYAIGGYNGSSNIATVEEYDPVANTWATRASMPTARGGLGAATINGKIYAVAGSNGSDLGTVEEYDPATDTWSSRGSIPTPRHNLGVAATSSGKLYAMGGLTGGNGDCCSKDTVEEGTVLMNRPPVVTVGGNAIVDEGSLLTRGGSFADPDADTWTATVDYGDGSGVQTLTLNTDKTFTLNHTYADNRATPYHVVVTVSDGHVPAGTASFDVTVSNVAPTASIVGTPTSSPEGTVINVIGSATDPSAADTAAGFTYAWSVTKNGIPYASGSGGAFAFTPDDNAAYLVTLSARDKDGGVGTEPRTVAVTNVAPKITSLTPSAASVDENGETSLSGAFSDPGTLDTHSVLISWGDGSTTSLDLPAGARSFSAGPHRYLDDNPTGTPADAYVIGVTVRDKDGESGSGTANLTVKNLSPVIVRVDGPSGPLALGSAASLVATFTDPGSQDTHICTFAWADGQATEVVGSGTCTGGHTYAQTGVYAVQVTVKDDDTDATTQRYEYVVVYDPNGGFVTGGGWINSPAGAYTANPALAGKATFGFVSKYKPGATAPTGNTEFIFHVAGMNFHSESYQWLVVAGARAQFKGTGTINGTGNYSFVLTAIDGQVPGGGGVDRFRIKITNGDTVVYDNQTGSADTDDLNTVDTVLQGGSVVIHKE